jgi:hypothetical protein
LTTSSGHEDVEELGRGDRLAVGAQVPDDLSSSNGSALYLADELSKIHFGHNQRVYLGRHLGDR